MTRAKYLNLHSALYWLKQHSQHKNYYTTIQKIFAYYKKLLVLQRLEIITFI